MIRQKNKAKPVYTPHLAFQSQLTDNQKQKCLEKFRSYKTEGSSMLSKHMLRKVLQEMGRQVSQEDLLEMICQADPNGHGCISYTAFENIVSSFKVQKEENVINPIGQTYDEILRCYRANYPQKSSQATLPWNYIEFYLEQNFGLKVNLRNFKNFHSRSQLSREDFQFIFS